MELNKYYTPEIEELYIGFECEHTTNMSAFEIDDIDRIYHSPLIIHELCDYITWSLEDGLDKFVRVKYLDQEDIESLGFVERLKNQWIGWKDYVKDIINPEYEYFMRVTLHTPRMGDLYKIYVHRYLQNERDDIDGLINYGESERIYKGLIKNKSELKSLLKKLNIE